MVCIQLYASLLKRRDREDVLSFNGVTIQTEILTFLYLCSENHLLRFYILAVISFVLDGVR